MSPVSREVSPAVLALRQPQIGHLIRELRQLMQLTQTEFAAELGVAYETLNRWENGHMQPSSLALKQIHAVVDQLSREASPDLREGSQALVGKYQEEDDL